MSDQLDLFSKRIDASKAEVRADVIPFPCSHRIGKARHAASKIVNKCTDKARQSYWIDLTSKMAAKMRREGVSNQRIECELDAFKALVQQILDAEAAGSAQK